MELLKEFLNLNTMQYPRGSDPMQNYFILRINLIYLDHPMLIHSILSVQTYNLVLNISD